jgi:hypothetical protein
MVVEIPSDAPGGRVTIELRPSTLSKIEALQQEWGLRSRGDTVERVLEELFREQDVA